MEIGQRVKRASLTDIDEREFGLYFTKLWEWLASSGCQQQAEPPQEAICTMLWRGAPARATFKFACHFVEKRQMTCGGVADLGLLVAAVG